MSSSKYTAVAIDAEGAETEIGTKSKKADAVELATSHRTDNKVAVQVRTAAGNVVLDMAAPKKINMSKPYTRTVELPEGVMVPEGHRVCYVRSRVGLALLHNPEAEKGKQYLFLNLDTGKRVKGTFATTREAGVAFRDARIAKQAAAAAAETEQETSETTPEPASA